MMTLLELHGRMEPLALPIFSMRSASTRFKESFARTRTALRWIYIARVSAIGRQIDCRKKVVPGTYFLHVAIVSLIVVSSRS